MGPLEVGEKPPHVVCMSAATQGHITPMLKMAKLLHARGFHVTFVNTEFNHRRLLRSRGPAALDGLPGFRFAAIPDGLPHSDDDATQDVAALCYSFATRLPYFLELLAGLNDPDSGVPAVTCLVVDAVMSFGYDAAKEIGVPCAALWTSSACGFMGYRHYRQLIERGLVPFKGNIAGNDLTTYEYHDTRSTSSTGRMTTTTTAHAFLLGKLQFGSSPTCTTGRRSRARWAPAIPACSPPLRCLWNKTTFLSV